MSYASRERNRSRTISSLVVLLFGAVAVVIWFLLGPNVGLKMGSAAADHTAQVHQPPQQAGDLEAASDSVASAKSALEISAAEAIPKPERETNSTLHKPAFTKSQVQFFISVGKRMALTDAEIAAGYGAFVEAAIGADDGRSALKAAHLLFNCRTVDANVTAAFSNLHGNTDKGSADRVQRQQAVQRQCQSIRPELQSKYPLLVERALKDGEPGAAAYLLGHYLQQRLPIQDHLKPQIVAGFKRDATHGDDNSLMLLGISGEALSLPAHEIAAYEFAWLTATGRVISEKIEFDSFFEKMSVVSSPNATEAEKREAASHFIPILLSHTRPALTSEQAKLALELAADVLGSRRKPGS